MPPSSADSLRHPVLRAAALAPIIRHFDGNVAAISGILRRNGLDPQRVQDPYEVIALSAYLQVFEDAARQARDPVLGARIGARINPADLGPTGLLMLQSSTARRGLQRFHDSLSALQSATEMKLTEAGTWLGFTYQIQSPGVTGLPQDAEFSLSGLCRLMRMSFDPRWSPEEVHFTHAPSARPDLLERIFGAPVLFGQSANRILFSEEGLDRHHRVEDMALIGLIEHHVADLVLAQDPEATMADQVLLVVSRNLGQRPVDLNSIARELGQAPRSLQRRLAAEGTSLRQIVRAHRQQIVETHLGTRSGSLKAMAQALGYSDGTVFWRAYRGWTGQAPSKENRG
ncbi:AraC family transcriptional regulator [Pseudooceanicola algae]|uniref:HTH-type transcriptional regulator VirS n=1 Tax=Pseudooceanicola algae TaxID=1537215 RepID=A0A418SHP6_9RHOB|nr:AraC family transcriptional regulator [Pseudooceanicola algae]QPM90280.1 HTH-type transcriptional regulator VirS [Pseudooceanicola algae]